MNFGNISPVVLFILFAWSLFWKGFALWHSAKLSQRNWFVVILILNTIGILEIAYLFFFAKEKFSFKNVKLSFKK